MDTYQIIGSGEPLLLLHGALLSKAMWQPQIAPFSNAYQVITYDLPVHGKTPDIIGAYTIPKLSETVLQLLDSLQIERTHLVGHSLGGMVAQQLAVDHPERIGKLVLAETAFGTKNSFGEQVQTFLARPFLSITPQKTLVNLSAKQYGTCNEAVGEFIRREMSQYDHKTSVRVMSAAFEFAGKAQLQQIQSPTLVLVAEDNKQTHAQGQVMADLIPNAKLDVIPQANHVLNIDNPKAFNQAVLNFLLEKDVDLPE